MSKSENKTKKTVASVDAFLAGVEPESRRRDCQTAAELMQEVTGEPAKMWGTSMVGFGDYHYRYDSGREGDSFLAGFSPRKQALTLYLMGTYCDDDRTLFDQLGKFKTGKACLYVKSLDDIDLDVLRQLIERSVAALKQRYG